jgi:hypothetical protein
MAKIAGLKLNLALHPLYSPDLAPSEFHLFQDRLPTWNKLILATLVKKVFHHQIANFSNDPRTVTLMA